MTKRAHDEVRFTVGSGNVFQDLGLESPDEELSKARLARQIHDRAVALGLNGTQLAARLLVPQPKASRLLRGFADGFSTEKLLVFLTRLGQDVRIVVSAARGRAELGKMTLTMPPPAARRPPRSRPRAVAGGRRTRAALNRFSSRSSRSRERSIPTRLPSGIAPSMSHRRLAEAGRDRRLVAIGSKAGHRAQREEGDECREDGKYSKSARHGCSLAGIKRCQPRNLGLPQPRLRREADQPVEPVRVNESLLPWQREARVPSQRGDRRHRLGEVMLPHMPAGVCERLALESPFGGDQVGVGSDKLVAGLSRLSEEVVKNERTGRCQRLSGSARRSDVSLRWKDGGRRSRQA